MTLKQAIHICKCLNDVSDITDAEKREAIDCILSNNESLVFGKSGNISEYTLLNIILWLKIRLPAEEE